MRPASAKAKGRRLQQALRTKILTAFPALEEADVKCAIMGESGEDLHLSPAARRLVPFSFECKAVERINIWDALEQAVANAPKGAAPAVVFRRNRSKNYIAVELDTFLELISR